MAVSGELKLWWEDFICNYGAKYVYGLCGGKAVTVVGGMLLWSVL
jgi:hypothetical protein